MRVRGEQRANVERERERETERERGLERWMIRGMLCSWGLSPCGLSWGASLGVLRA